MQSVFSQNSMELTPAIIKLTDGTIDNDFELNIIQNIIGNDISKIQLDSNDQIYLLGRDFSNGAKIRLADLIVTVQSTILSLYQI